MLNRTKKLVPAALQLMDARNISGQSAAIPSLQPYLWFISLERAWVNTFLSEFQIYMVGIISEGLWQVLLTLASRFQISSFLPRHLDDLRLSGISSFPHLPIISPYQEVHVKGSIFFGGGLIHLKIDERGVAFIALR